MQEAVTGSDSTPVKTSTKSPEKVEEATFVPEADEELNNF